MFITHERSQRMLKFLFRNKFKVLVLLVATSGLAACYSAFNPGPNERRNFTVCLTDEALSADCKKPLQVSVLKRADPGHFTPDYLASIKDANLTLRLPANQKLMSYESPSYSQADIDFAPETFADRYSRYARTDPFGSGFGYAINRVEGNLVAVKETEPGEAGNELLIPANGDKSIFIRCVKQYRATAGNLVTNPGCQVYTQFQPYVFVQFGIQRQYLQEWESIKDDLGTKIRSVMTIN